jgi:hypothetical protein
MHREDVGETSLAGPAAIEWPQGGFQWSPELVADLPFVRGIRAAALPAGDGLWDETIVLADDDRYGMYAHQLNQMAQAAGRSWSLWGSQRSAELMQREQMVQADPEFWLELCAQAAAAHLRPRAQGQEQPLRYLQYYGLLWVTRAGLALHGLLFMVDLALRMGRIVYQGDWLHGRSTAEASMFEPLRIVITSCSDDDHAAVIDWLQEHGQGTAQDRLVSAYLCAHRGDWAAASLADGLEAAPGMLKECALPLEAAQSLLERVSLRMHYLRGLLILQFRLHGTAAFALLAQALRGTMDSHASEAMADLATSVGIPQQIDLLVELMHRKEVRAQLERVAGRYPAAVLRTVAEHLARGMPGAHARLIEGWAVRLALSEPAALAQALAALSPRDREQFQALLDARQGNEARPDQLPPLLRAPPWLAGARAPELPVLDVAPRVPAERLAWSEAERVTRSVYQLDPMLAFRMSVNPADLYWRLTISEAGQARLMSGQWLQPGDVPDPQQSYLRSSPEAVLALPDAAGLALWNSYPAEFWSTYADHLAPVPAILARHGVAALPGLVRYVQVHPVHGLRLALPVDSARLVPAVLYALHHVKQAAVPATDWLRAHPAAALAAALPLAFAKDKAVRGPAQAGLRWLAQAGFAAQARQAAAAYGPAMEQALNALLDTDPLLLLPARMPGLPGFFVAASLHRPRLRSGGTLPVAALEHLGRMLAISKLEAPYAGLDVVRQACTPASLAEFAWDVFEAWMAAGTPSKNNWAFAALGLLGDDETVRRLVPRIREWPGQAAHLRAVAGLDMLAAIGTDVALMQLDGLASRAKSKLLRDRAKEKTASVAAARGLGTDELADRLVPDLGLDEQGTLVLDFGPRRFLVDFDETLKPFVKDAQGVRLKDLPKPLKSDDAALAQAATARYKQTKKDAKTVAGLQVARLERCMVEQRRWPAADFRRFFLAHPLLRHLAARLVWGVYETGQLAEAFRVAEDWTLADAQDALYELADTATVGIAHVLEMPAPLQADFGQMLADYEILQPFRQLGREAFTLSPQELQATEIQRFAGLMVATGSVLGLLNRGWERGPETEGTWAGGISKRLGNGLEAQLPLQPGFDLGSPAAEPGQRLDGLLLCQAGARGGSGTAAFSRLAPITASEVLRDVALLAPFKE